MEEILIKQTSNLKHRFKEAVKFLKKTKILKKDGGVRLFDQPWYLFTGPSNSGKTTVILNSELNFILKKNLSKPNDQKPSRTYDWWVTEDAVIIDTPNHHHLSISDQSYLWGNFLKLLKKHIRKEKLQGVIIVLSINKITSLSKTQTETFYQTIKNQISTIQKSFSADIPFFLLFNKCDLITGFQDFFSESSKEERQQPLGVLINDKLDNNVIDEKLNGLLNKLNNQIIWRLQRENNHYKKALINDFPLQMTQLKPHLIAVINNLFSGFKNPPTVKGIFFTSATQANSSLSSKAKSLNTQTHSAPISSESRHAFFVHDVLKKIIFHLSHSKKTPTSYLKLSIQTACFLSIATVFILFFYLTTPSIKQEIISFNLAQRTITAHQILTQEKPLAKVSFSDQLKLLNTLQKTIQAFDTQPKYKFDFAFILSRHYVNNNLKESIIKTYKTSLEKTIAPKITTTLTNVIADQNTSLEQLYPALKSYLMLTNMIKADPNYIITTMQRIWGSKYKKETLAQLTTHLSFLLQHRDIPLQPNNNIIKTAQQRLKTLNVNKLAYLILINSIPNIQLLSLNLSDNKNAAQIFTFANINIGILSLYTKEIFTKIYPVSLYMATQEALLGNKIIGNINSNQIITKDHIDKLANEIFQQYVNEYANTWIRFLNNIKIINFTELSQLKSSLDTLDDRNSLLLQLINLVQDNLVPQVTEANPRLNAFSILASQQTSPTTLTKNITHSLANLKEYLATITSATEPSKQAFKAACSRMHNYGQGDAIGQLMLLSQQAPEPIKNWLYTIAINSWQLILYQTQNYINQNWQKNIISQYKTQLIDHYPFSATASNQVSLSSFSYFFAQNGLLNNFFNTYLEPFLDTSQKPWKLKTLDGHGLTISQTTLKSLQQANYIQHAYFPGNTKQIYIPFTLQPEKLNDNIAFFTIALGEQKAIYKNNPSFPKTHFIWPDNSNSNLTTIIFTDNNDQQTILKQTGPWGWLTLLEQGKLHLKKKTKQYTATFHKKNSSAKILITTKKHKNPFSLKQFRKFSLPDEI